MKVLVTGGAGYFGSIVVEGLLDNGHEVVVIDNLMYGYKDILKKTELINKDITEMELEPIIKDVDAVIHLAAIVGDVAVDIRRDYGIKVNYMITEQLAKLCKKYDKKFIFSSTCSVYGAQKDQEINEESELYPVSVYALSKVASENSIMKLADNNFKPIIFRMGTLFGLSHRMRFDLVINLFIGKALQEGYFTVFGGNQWRPFVHVKDASKYYIKGIESDIGGIFNIGGFNSKIIDIANTIKEKMNCKVEIRSELEDKRNYIVSSEKLKRTFGMKFEKDVEFTIEEIKSAQVGNYRNPIYSNAKMQEAYK